MSDHHYGTRSKSGKISRSSISKAYISGDELDEWFEDGEVYVDDDISGEYKEYYRNAYGGFIKKLYEDFRLKEFNNGCCKCRGTFAVKNHPDYPGSGFSIDHKISVKKHWDDGGDKLEYEQRRAWYNDQNNWQAMHRSCNSRKGAKSL